MIFKKYPVSQNAQSIIASFWTLRSDPEKEANISYRFIPDGYVDWVFHLEEPWEYCIPARDTQKKKYTSHIFGQIKNYLDLTLPAGNMFLFGVKFHPWAARQIWKFDLNEVTDYSVGLSELQNPGLCFLADQIHETKGIFNKIKIVESYVLKNNIHQKKDSLAPIIKKITQNALTFSISNFSISKRRLEQRFKSEIGISPKLFQRTIRINNIMERLIQNPDTQLTQLAYDFNFYDQSHFISDFKQFTGCAPSKFIKAISPSGEIYNFKISK